MKSLTRLWMELATEAGYQCGVSVEKDIETVLSRVEDEGSSFLTITLPRFGSDFESCLDWKCVSSGSFQGFSRTRGLPKFLSGFLRKIFDARTGELLDSPDVHAIRVVRQLTLLCKKVEIDCSDERKVAAVESFRRCEDDIASLVMPGTLPALQRVFTYLFGETLAKLNRKVQDFSLDPRHGPGATADRKIGNEKFIQTEWTDRLEAVFPFGEFALPSWRYFDAGAVRWRSEAHEVPVKVTLVPKTLKTPRVIAIEPSYMQYMQQAIARELVSLLEADPVCNPFVGFTDQGRNRELARIGSQDGFLATIDLSEASDRVSWELVQSLLRPWTDVLAAVDATRSRSARLPFSDEVIPLRKFASMGSALCFPIETMVFSAIAVMGSLGDPFARPSMIRNLVGRVRAYGDDIIVPTSSTTEVMAHLESFGLKVNHSKSFWNGKFRESCGGDYYDGEWVTPIRLRRLMPKSRRDVEAVASWVSTRNALWHAGYRSTANWMRHEIEAVIGPLPHVSDSSSALGWTDPDITLDPRLRVRWNKKLHRVEVQSWALSSPDHRFEIDGPWALMKCLSGDWSDPIDREHLKAHGRSSSVRMKKTWMEPDPL